MWVHVVVSECIKTYDHFWIAANGTNYGGKEGGCIYFWEKLLLSKVLVSNYREPKEKGKSNGSVVVWSNCSLRKVLSSNFNIYIVCMSLAILSEKMSFKKKQRDGKEERGRENDMKPTHSQLLMQKLAYLADFAGQIDWHGMEA